MADAKTPLPNLPRPTKDYTAVWANDLVRQLEMMMTLLRSPGEGRQTTIVLTRLASADAGLEVGTLYDLGDGIVRIVRVNTAIPASFPLSASIGTVTVSIV